MVGFAGGEAAEGLGGVARRKEAEHDRLGEVAPEQRRHDEVLEERDEAGLGERPRHEVARDEAGEVDAPVGDLEDEEERGRRVFQPRLVVEQRARA